MSEPTRHTQEAGASEDSNVVPLVRAKAPDLTDLRQAGRPIVRIHLRGRMRATSYLGDDILPRGKKARAILGYLCLAAGECVPRSRLAAMLWDRVLDSQARTSFRQALRELTTAMGALADELIVADRETVKLDPRPCWIDASAILAPDLSPPASLRGDLAALCAGELLEGLDGSSASFDQWLFGERMRFTERLGTLLEAELRQFDRPDVAAEQRASIARGLIAFDPTHEGASRALMRALVDMGERAQALREYARCREALNKTLDVEPSPETRALHQAIRTFTGREECEKSQALSSAQPMQPPSSTPLAPARDRLRIGVLPFLSTLPTQDNSLALPLSQEIAGALSRFRWFDVIAPVALMQRPSHTPASEDLLARNELDYVVDGAVSGNGKKFSISVRLIDLAHYARPVWSDRFDVAAGQLHKLNDLVTARIVGQIDPVILFIESQPKRRRYYGGTGLLLLAMPLLYSMERAKYEEAGRLINCAIEMAPDDAMIAAWGAYWQVFYVGQGWTQDAAGAFRTAQALALRAIKLDPENAEALGIYGHVCAFLDKDFQSAVHFFERSQRLNPNLAFIWALSAATYCYTGEPDEALRRLERYRDLAPFDPYFSLLENVFTMAHTIKGNYEEAVTIGRRVVAATPDFVNGYKPLIAALGHLGRVDEAQPFIAMLMALEPNFSVAQFGRKYPLQKASDRERYMRGLRLAGVPEV